MEETAGAASAENATVIPDDAAPAPSEHELLREEAREERDRAAIAIAEAARLSIELAAATDAVSAFEADVASMRALLDEAEARALEDAARAQEDAARYRELALRGEPALPPDMIRGDTVEAVDVSLGEARAVAGRVRSHIEAEAQAMRVPAGAPARTAPDLNAMTPEQKIRYGLAQRAQ